MERRLAAILAADIVGYSRLMDRDEARTVRLVNQLQSEVIEPVIFQNEGRVFKTMGDGLLVEFTSVVNAVTCAQAWQRAIAASQAGDASDFRIDYRIGISLGEVIVQGDDLFGTGVNIAARLEALAAPGAICVTAEVHAQCSGRIATEFHDQGEQELKNISGRHRVYSLAVSNDDPGIGQDDNNGSRTPDGPDPVDQSRGGGLRDDGAPSLAVLPFADINTDDPNVFLAEGFSDEIVATLSRSRWLFLVATGSSTDRKQNEDARSIAKDLGVRYVLQGRFMASSDRIRVTATLIDWLSGATLRSFRFDQMVSDPFQVIDDISIGVVGELIPEISQRERSRIRRRHDGDLTSWELYLRALDALRRTSPEACREASDLLNQAIDIQPDLAIAHARLATCAIHEGYFGWAKRPIETVVAEAMEHASRALEIDPDEALACDALASAYQLVKNFTEAEYWARKAIDLNPTCVPAYGTLVTLLAMRGEPAEALDFYDQLLRISPRDPEISSALMGACMAHFHSGDMGAALDAARKHAVLRPNWYGNRIYAAAALGHLGKKDLAAEAVRKIHELEPGLTVRDHRDRTVLQRDQDIERLINGLRMAGLPE